jgi:hypothetical protein
MTLTAVQKYGDLDPSIRDWIARLLGSDADRFAEDAELHLELRSHSSEITPRDAAPAIAAIMARMESRLRSIPNDDLEDALDEAMQSVRPAFRR